MKNAHTAIKLRPGVTVCEWGVGWVRVYRERKHIVDLPTGRAAEMFDLPALHRKTRGAQ